MADLNKLEELNLTHDEIKRFTEAMQKPEFKELFLEYAHEISDPENRARYESEIQQMENERGMDIKFVNPDPGYVIKTTINGDTKAFINVCKNQHIGKPSSAKQIGHDGRPGLSWSLPHSFTPPREDISKTGTRCTVFDFVVHPDTYRMAETNPRFKKMVSETALEGIKKMFNVDVDLKNLRFPKMKYKGNPTPTVIRNKLPESTEAINHDPDNLSSRFPYPYDNKTSEERAKEIMEHNEKVQASRGEKETNEKKPPPENEFTIPKYAIKYQSNIEMQDFINASDVRNSTRPKNLIIEVDLPLLQSANSIILDIFEKRLSLVSHKPAKYKLDISLAYPVDENDGSAKFDKNKSKLIVTLPILSDKNIPKLPFSGETFENGKDGAGTEDNESDAESSGLGLMSKTEQVMPLIEVLSDKESEPTEGDNSCASTNGEKAALAAAKNVNHSYVNLAHDLVCLLPDFECQQDDASLLFTFATKKVRKESLVSSVLSHNAISVKMTSVGSGGFPVYYGCCLKFEDDCYIDGNNCRMSFSEKEIVSLLVTKDIRTSNGPWKSYSVGVNMSHLEKRALEMKTSFVSTDRAETSSQTPLSTKSSVEPDMNNDTDQSPVMDSEFLKSESISNESEIVLVQMQETPELHGTLKQPSMSESSDSSEGASTIHRRTSITASGSEADDASKSATDAPLSGLKKSVSFSAQVDKTVFVGNQSVSQMHAALKTKRKNVRKREKRQQLKQERRNSHGSVDCGDDQHVDQSEGDVLQIKREKTMSGSVLVAAESGKVEVDRGHVDRGSGGLPADRNTIRPNSDDDDAINSSSYTEKINEGTVGIKNCDQCAEKGETLVCSSSESENTEGHDSIKNLQGITGNKDITSGDLAMSHLNTSAENDVVAEKNLEDFKSAAIPLVSDWEKPTPAASVNNEGKTNLSVELKNKFVFDLDVD